MTSSTPARSSPACRELSQSELAVVAAYERTRRNRRTIMERVDDLTADEPWPGYDSGHDRGPGRAGRLHRGGRARLREPPPPPVAVLEAAQNALASS